MAQKTFTLGISAIKLGQIPTSGGMAPASSLATIGYTNENSATLNFEEPEKTEFYAEEVDDPVLVFKKQGKITFNFDVMNPDVDTLADLMGGRAVDSATGQPAVSPAENDTWQAPATSVQVERAIVITPRMGYEISIPRADITARMGDNLTKTELLVLHISGTILAPADGTTPKVSFKRL